MKVYPGMKNPLFCFANLILITTFCHFGGAAKAESEEYFGVYSTKTEGWDLTLTPYMFVPVSVSAESTVNGGTVPLDLNLSDTLNLFNGAFAGRFESRSPTSPWLP